MRYPAASKNIIKKSGGKLIHQRMSSGQYQSLPSSVKGSSTAIRKGVNNQINIKGILKWLNSGTHYHGTDGKVRTRGYGEFPVSKIGHWTTKNAKVANTFKGSSKDGKVYKYKPNFKRPFIVRPEKTKISQMGGGKKFMDDINFEVRRDPITKVNDYIEGKSKGIHKRVYIGNEPTLDLDNPKMMSSVNKRIDKNVSNLTSKLQKKGYDSIVFQDTTYDRPKGKKTTNQVASIRSKKSSIKYPSKTLKHLKRAFKSAGGGSGMGGHSEIDKMVNPTIKLKK